MSYLDVLEFPVNYVTARDVLNLKGLRQDAPNVVLRHDYDSLRNCYPILLAEQKKGVVSSNYLLVNKYKIFTRGFRKVEKDGVEFGLHLDYMKSHSFTKEITAFKKLGLQLTTMTPHGWVNSKGEYPTFGNWEADRKFVIGKDGWVCSATRFYEFCHEQFGRYDTTHDIARYYSLTGKSFFEIPHRGVLLIDDSAGWRKPFTEHNVLEHMENGKVYVFLFHPANITSQLEFRVYQSRIMHRMEWDSQFKHNLVVAH